MYPFPLPPSASIFRKITASHLQGGAFYFLEHVVSEPSTWTYFFQHVLEPLWYYLGDGCMVTRATWRDLEAAGFSEIHLRHIDAPEVTPIIRPHIMGYCIKWLHGRITLDFASCRLPFTFSYSLNKNPLATLHLLSENIFIYLQNQQRLIHYLFFPTPPKMYIINITWTLCFFFPWLSK